MRKWRQLVAGMAVAGAATVGAAASASAQNWSGLYFGGHLGGAWGDQSWSMQNGAFREDFSHSPSAAVYGAQVGIQHQWNNLVAGIEVSFTGNTDLHESSDAGNAALIGVGRVRRTQFDSLTMVSARLGWAAGNLMPYIKGGYAGGNVQFDSGNQSAAGIARMNGDGEWSSGWNIGGGLEWAWTPNVILGVQYDYISLEGKNRPNHLFTNGGAAPIFDVSDAEIHMVTARLSFKLGRPSAPAPLK